MVRPRPALGRGCIGSPHACGDGPHHIQRRPQPVPFSPRVWGWSGLSRSHSPHAQVLPTRVGMVRCQGPGRLSAPSSPHACGDGPRRIATLSPDEQFSPRVWGWSGGEGRPRDRDGVLPTRVGMVRLCLLGMTPPARSPHACGDGPLMLAFPEAPVAFSPRVWGWSDHVLRHLVCGRVLPTRVGMVRAGPTCRTVRRCSPHACGDGPRRAPESDDLFTFSPRVWGWSFVQNWQPPAVLVLPTRVGMVRWDWMWCRRLGRSPHACGDGPAALTKYVMHT